MIRRINLEGIIKYPVRKRAEIRVKVGEKSRNTGGLD